MKFAKGDRIEVLPRPYFQNWLHGRRGCVLDTSMTGPKRVGRQTYIRLTLDGKKGHFDLWPQDLRRLSVLELLAEAAA